MAKKLRRVTTPLWILFMQLLTPWVAMGLIAATASSAGAPAYLVFILAIGGALIVTWAVYMLERRRKARLGRS